MCKKYQFQLMTFVTAEYNIDIFLHVLAFTVPFLAFLLRYNILCLNITWVRIYDVKRNTYRETYLDIYLDTHRQRNQLIVNQFYLKYFREKIINNRCSMNTDARHYGTNSF